MSLKLMSGLFQVILGDSAYPNTNWLISPFLGAVNGPKSRCNRAHISTRNCIELAFGVVKQRFYALSTGLRGKNMDFATKLVQCAFILYKMCIAIGDDGASFQENEVVQANVGQEAPVPMPQNENRRQQILQTFL